MKLKQFTAKIHDKLFPSYLKELSECYSVDDAIVWKQKLTLELNTLRLQGEQPQEHDNKHITEGEDEKKQHKLVNQMRLLVQTIGNIEVDWQE